MSLSISNSFSANNFYYFSFLHSLLCARLLQTRGFKRNIKARTNKPVTSIISKTPNPPNLFEGPTLTLSDGSKFTCINTLQLSLKAPLLKQLMPNVVPEIKDETLPPLTRKPKSFPAFRSLTEEEHHKLIALRINDPKRYTVSKCAKLFNCPPFQIMQTVHSPLEYKQALAARLDKGKYRRRKIIRARRKEIFENAWHHYHS